MRKSLLSSLVLAIALGVFASSASAQVVRLEPKVQLSQAQYARLQAIAREGPDALRQFLWRTRMIYNWSWSDLVNVEV